MHHNHKPSCHCSSGIICRTVALVCNVMVTENTKKCKRNNVIQVADYLHLIKEGTVPVAEEGLSKCTYAYLYAWGNGGGKEWHHVGFLIGRVGKAKTPGTEPSSVLEMLQESVGGSWMAVLDEQRPRSYQPPVA